MRRRRFKLVDVSPVSKEKTRSDPNANCRFSRISGFSPLQVENQTRDHGDTCGEEKCRRPYLKNGIELIIPLDAPDIYRWWAGGQSVFDTLLELEAPDSLIEQHIEEIGSPRHWERWQLMRKARTVRGGQQDSGNLPNDFDKSVEGE